MEYQLHLKLLVKAIVEVLTPHTNSPLLAIAPFTVPRRDLDKPVTVRREVLKVVAELCRSGNPEFRLATVLEILNPEGDPQRRWSIEAAVFRMHRGDKGRVPEIVRVGRGLYRKL